MRFLLQSIPHTGVEGLLRALCHLTTSYRHGVDVVRVGFKVHAESIPLLRILLELLDLLGREVEAL